MPTDNTRIEYPEHFRKRLETELISLITAPQAELKKDIATSESIVEQGGESLSPNLKARVDILEKKMNQIMIKLGIDDKTEVLVVSNQIGETPEEYAYRMGWDCAVNGANLVNCHFSIFSSPEKARAWEKGEKDAGNKI